MDWKYLLAYKYLCISSLVLSPNVFAEYKSFYVGKLMVEYLLGVPINTNSECPEE